MRSAETYLSLKPIPSEQLKALSLLLCTILIVSLMGFGVSARVREESVQDALLSVGRKSPKGKGEVTKDSMVNWVQ